MIEPRHVVAIFGGAVAGSEAASKLCEKGVRCVVFEQNPLPYGKIESGLPKWHVKLRDREEAKIDSKLTHPLVSFVPMVKLGKDLDFTTLLDEWGFSVILLATGAWKDRPLSPEGIDRFLNHGFYYQNAFVSWFNKNHDPRFDDPNYHVADNAIIIGGGLASIDVAKIVMIETFRKALEKEGVTANVLDIEKKGIPAILEDLGMTFDELQLKGCTLYYRRQLTDMPLSSLPENPSERDFETAHRVRQKIMDNVQKKFLFRFAGCHQPVRIISEGDLLKGLVFQKTEIIDGNLHIKPDSEYPVSSPLIISAIGSRPESISGLAYSGQSFEIENQDSGQLKGFENVFALGNAVTGRGNIKESQLHGRRVSEQVIDEFLAWQPEDYEEIFNRAIENADRKVEMIGDQLQKCDVLSKEKVEEILTRVNILQEKVGYNQDYIAWIGKHLPLRLENMIEAESG